MISEKHRASAINKPPIYLTRVDSLKWIEPVIEVARETWIDDPCFAYFNPGRHEHPNEFRAVWDYLLRSEYATPGTVIIVASDGGNRHGSSIMGFAVWERVGKSDLAKSWQGDSMARRIMRTKQMLRMGWHFLFPHFMKSVSFERAREVMKETHDANHLHVKEHWRLSQLAVSPQYQRCGVERRLIQWGLERSDEEGAVAVLEATMAEQALYERFGFKHDGWVKFDEGKQKYSIMIREPNLVGRKMR